MFVHVRARIIVMSLFSLGLSHKLKSSKTSQNNIASYNNTNVENDAVGMISLII